MESLGGSPEAIYVVDIQNVTKPEIMSLRIAPRHRYFATKAEALGFVGNDEEINGEVIHYIFEIKNLKGGPTAELRVESSEIMTTPSIASGEQVSDRHFSSAKTCWYKCKKVIRANQDAPKEYSAGQPVPLYRKERFFTDVLVRVFELRGGNYEILNYNEKTRQFNFKGQFVINGMTTQPLTLGKPDKNDFTLGGVYWLQVGKSGKVFKYASAPEVREEEPDVLSGRPSRDSIGPNQQF